MELTKIINKDGSKTTVAVNDEFIIYPSEGGWKATTIRNYNSRITDVTLITSFSYKEGFYSLEDCIKYVEKYTK